MDFWITAVIVFLLCTAINLPFHVMEYREDQRKKQGKSAEQPKPAVSHLLYRVGLCDQPFDLGRLVFGVHHGRASDQLRRSGAFQSPDHSQAHADQIAPLSDLQYSGFLHGRNDLRDRGLCFGDPRNLEKQKEQSERIKTKKTY